jgi:hypothetical protein
LTNPVRQVTLVARFSDLLEMEARMRAQFLGKDPDSQVGNSPTLFATDRTDRRTYIAQGWRVTDPQALADIGPIPDHETLVEIPEEVLRFYVHRYQGQEGDR